MSLIIRQLITLWRVIVFQIRNLIISFSLVGCAYIDEDDLTESILKRYKPHLTGLISMFLSLLLLLSSLQILNTINSLKISTPHKNIKNKLR